MLQYKTVTRLSGLATGALRTGNGFTVTTAAGATFAARKLLFATGVYDELPAIEGFAACWGISVLHCPYCHGYEVRHQPLGLVGNGDTGFELARLLHNWSQRLTLFTNGPSTLTEAQAQKLAARNIAVVEKEIAAFEHEQGHIKSIRFSNRSVQPAAAVFTRVPFRQHCVLPESLGCTLTGAGYIQVDEICRTTLPGVYAAGDSTTMFRAVSIAVASGTRAGAALNRELIEEAF